MELLVGRGEVDCAIGESDVGLTDGDKAPWEVTESCDMSLMKFNQKGVLNKNDKKRTIM